MRRKIYKKYEKSKLIKKCRNFTFFASFLTKNSKFTAFLHYFFILKFSNIGTRKQ